MKVKPSPLRIFAAGLAFLVMNLGCSRTESTSYEPYVPADEPPPEASNTKQPTNPPEPTTTPTQEPDIVEEPSCYKWDEITLDMAGEVVCVYGTATSHQGQSRIDFSPEINTFFLIDPTYFYGSLSEGVCVVAKEEIEIFDQVIPFMTLDGDLYGCEPWMEK